jgi:hypothetical protein
MSDGFCSECRKPCVKIRRDYGIGSYEYWGATGVHHNWQTVSECCEEDVLEEIEDEESEE